MALTSAHHEAASADHGRKVGGYTMDYCPVRIHGSGFGLDDGAVVLVQIEDADDRGLVGRFTGSSAAAR